MRVRLCGVLALICSYADTKTNVGFCAFCLYVARLARVSVVLRLKRCAL